MKSHFLRHLFVGITLSLVFFQLTAQNKVHFDHRPYSPRGDGQSYESIRVFIHFQRDPNQRVQAVTTAEFAPAHYTYKGRKYTFRNGQAYNAAGESMGYFSPMRERLNFEVSLSSGLVYTCKMLGNKSAECPFQIVYEGGSTIDRDKRDREVDQLSILAIRIIDGTPERHRELELAIDRYDGQGQATSTNNQRSEETHTTSNSPTTSESQQSTRRQAFNEKLGTELVKKFTQIADSWAKERDFQARVSSLTAIRNVDASSIISEARQKRQAINSEYEQRKVDAINQINTTYGVSTGDDTQDAVNATAGLIAAGISQSSLEKERREAQEKLEKEKELALKKLAQQIINKYTPIRKQHMEAAALAVSIEKETYHLAHYKHANCMVKNAYNIVISNSMCKQPSLSKPAASSNSIRSGQFYFDTYQRKSKSPYKFMRSGAAYFLELAIEKQPDNTNWLYTKASLKSTPLDEKVDLLAICMAAEPENLNYSNAYEATNQILNERAIAKEEGYQGVHESFNQDYQYPLYEAPRVFQENYEGKYKAVWPANHKGLLRVEYKKKFGLAKENGDPLTPVIYLSFDEFHEGKAVVQNKEKKYGFINSEGVVIIPFQFIDKPRPFSEGLALVRNEQGLVFIDEKGNTRLELDFDQALDFKNGLAGVCRNGKCGFIDKSGITQIPLNYDDVENFSKVMKNRARVWIGKDWEAKLGYVNINGEEIIAPGEYDGLDYYPDAGVFKVSRKINGERKYGILDYNGSLVVPVKYDGLELATEVMEARIGKKYGFLNYKNEIIAPIEFVNAHHYYEQKILSLTKTDGTEVFYSIQGKQVEISGVDDMGRPTGIKK